MVEGDVGWGCCRHLLGMAEVLVVVSAATLLEAALVESPADGRVTTPLYSGEDCTGRSLCMEDEVPHTTGLVDDQPDSSGETFLCPYLLAEIPVSLESPVHPADVDSSFLYPASGPELVRGHKQGVKDAGRSHEARAR